jgi:hypothetical protein
VNEREGRATQFNPTRCIRVNRWRIWASRLALVVLPVLLALVGYARVGLGGGALPRPRGDAAFYAYQLQRAAECHGRWWSIATDERIGHPYPSEFAKHPGLFEGVDLMLLAALLGGGLSAAWTYHVAALAALTMNGWVAALIVRRYTRSTLWALAAVALITLNESVAARVVVHLHLFKFGWALLAVWAFVLFLEHPAWWRGLLLGLAVGLALQASFYLGFFVGLGLGSWLLVEIVAGRVGRDLVRPSIVAGLVFFAAAALFCFPVWTNYSPIAGSEQYFHRSWAETWVYGSEVWKYFVPKNSWLGANYFRDLRHKVPAPTMDEGWNFPGFTVILATLFAGVAWLRGSEICKRLDRFVWVSLGLMMFWLIMSLAGGPSALLFHAIPGFRCYGRAGLLVVALGSVMAPIVLSEFVKSCRRPFVRNLLTLGLLVLVISDTGRAALTFKGWPQESAVPEWVDWLRHEKADDRLAILATHPVIPSKLEETTEDNEPFYWWGVSSVEWLPMHGHSTLMGASFSLLEGDLQLLGASYDRMNPAGLRFLGSIGYAAFAVEEGYLAANPWIEHVPWLDPVGRRGRWRFYRTNDQYTAFPKTSLEHLLARGQTDLGPRTAPPGCWITAPWPVEHDTIVTHADWAFLAWNDRRGRLISELRPAFYQHVFGPGIPAYTLRTPAQPGEYRLVVFDRHHRKRAGFDYQIVADMAVSQPRFPARRPSITVSPLILCETPPSEPVAAWRLTVANRSSAYIQAQVFRQHLNPISQTHPGMRSQWQRASDGGLVLRLSATNGGSGADDLAWELPMPADLPPGGQIKVVIPTDRIPVSWVGRPLKVEPSFTGVGHAEVSSMPADLTIAIDESPTEIAGRKGSDTIGPR